MSDGEISIIERKRSSTISSGESTQPKQPKMSSFAATLKAAIEDQKKKKEEKEEKLPESNCIRTSIGSRDEAM